MKEVKNRLWCSVPSFWPLLSLETVTWLSLSSFALLFADIIGILEGISSRSWSVDFFLCCSRDQLWSWYPLPAMPEAWLPAFYYLSFPPFILVLNDVCLFVCLCVLIWFWRLTTTKGEEITWDGGFRAEGYKYSNLCLGVKTQVICKIAHESL